MFGHRFAGVVLLLVLIGCGQDASPPASPTRPAPTPQGSADGGEGVFSELGQPSEATVKLLVDQLKSRDVTVRREAAERLAKKAAWSSKLLGWQEQLQEMSGSQTRPANTIAAATGALVAALDDPDGDVAAYAAEALGDIGDCPAEGLAKLRALFKSKHAFARSRAIWAVGELDARPSDAEAFLSATKDAEPLVRYQAITALTNLPEMTEPVTAALLAAAKDAEPFVRAGAIGLLSDLEDPPEATAELVLAATRDPAAEVRTAAAKLLADLDVKPERAVAALLPLLSDEEDEVRLRSAQAMAELGRHAAPALEPLLKLLKEGEWLTAGAAARALVEIRPVDPRLVPALMKPLREKTFGLNDDAMAALAKLGEAARPAIPLIVERLRADPKKDIFARERAAKALGELGPVAAEAVPAMIEVAKESEGNNLGYVLGALGDIGPDAAPAVPLLIEHIDHPKDSVGWIAINAINALGTIGPKAKSAIPRLRELFADPATDGRFNSKYHSAGIALLRLGVVDEVLPTYVKSLDDEKPWRRSRALQALAVAGKADEATIAKVVAIAGDAESPLQEAACQVLMSWTQGDLRPAALDGLRRLAGSEDEHVRSMAAITIGAVRPATVELRSILEKLARDKSKTVRTYAAQMLADLPATQPAQ